MEDVLKYNASTDNSNDWLANHTLSSEQVAQLIRNKIERAKIYQRKEDKVCFDD